MDILRANLHLSFLDTWLSSFFLEELGYDVRLELKVEILIKYYQ